MMNVFHALKLLRFDHQQLNHAQVVITAPDGKPDAQLSELLGDCMNKMDIFVNLDSVDTVTDVIDDLHLMTPLPFDVLDEYHKILDQPIQAINFASHKQLIELVYQPFD